MMAEGEAARGFDVRFPEFLVDRGHSGMAEVAVEFSVRRREARGMIAVARHMLRRFVG